MSREPLFERLIYLKVGGTPPGQHGACSNDYHIVLLHREAVADHADQLIADAREQINRADDLLEQLKMQRVGRRIRSSSQDLSPAR